MSSINTATNSYSYASVAQFNKLPDSQLPTFDDFDTLTDEQIDSAFNTPAQFEKSSAQLNKERVALEKTVTKVASTVEKTVSNVSFEDLFKLSDEQIEFEDKILKDSEERLEVASNRLNDKKSAEKTASKVASVVEKTVSKVETLPSVEKAASITASHSKFVVILSSTPPEPDSTAIEASLAKGQSVNRKEADMWIAAHHPYYQPALKSLVDSIKMISFSSFKEELRKVTIKFDSVISGLKDKSYVVLVQPGKSNQWVAEVALQYLTNKPTQSIALGEKEAREYCKYLDTVDKTNLKEPVVLFDDASYSGSQAYGHVEAIVTKYAKLGLKTPSIYVIVPFATKQALAKLQSISLREKTLKVFSSAIIPSIADVLGKKADPLRELYRWTQKASEVHSRGLVYFAHKVPNFWSFVAMLAEGKVCQSYNMKYQVAKLDDTVRYKILPEIKPPYKA